MQSNYKKIVIIGATSAIAEHCARLWVKDVKISLVLVGRDLKKISPMAADLRIRSPESTIITQEANFIDPTLITELVDAIVADGPVDLVLIAHGTLPAQTTCQTDLTITNHTLNINGISPVLFAEAFAGHMQQVNHGTIAIISSVAGERGRKSNYVYGAAKGLVSRYAEGLQHRLAKTGVNVVLIKPGPTATPMTAHLPQKPGSKARVEDVAHRIVSKINQRQSVIYAPAKWTFIMLIIRNLPKFIFNKMDI